MTFPEQGPCSNCLRHAELNAALLCTDCRPKARADCAMCHGYGGVMGYSCEDCGGDGTLCCTTPVCLCGSGR